MKSTPFSRFSGFDIVELRADPCFAERHHLARDVVREIEAMRRLAHVFAHHPQDILTELASIAMALCGADAACVTLEEFTPEGERQFRWVATAGTYASFIGSVLPVEFSPCQVCLDRNQPQLFSLPRDFLDILGVDAPPITDGLVVPFQEGDTRGALWVASNQSSALFDAQDSRELRSLADFAAIAVRHQAQQEKLTEHAATSAAASMGNHFAHRINNPLQSLMNTVYLASQTDTHAGLFARQVNEDLLELSALVKELLHLPKSY